MVLAEQTIAGSAVRSELGVDLVVFQRFLLAAVCRLFVRLASRLRIPLAGRLRISCIIWLDLFIQTFRAFIIEMIIQITVRAVR